MNSVSSPAESRGTSEKRPKLNSACPAPQTYIIWGKVCFHKVNQKEIVVLSYNDTSEVGMNPGEDG